LDGGCVFLCGGFLPPLPAGADLTRPGFPANTGTGRTTLPVIL
jgi:hypothetical protein